MSRIRQILELSQILALPGALGALRTWKPFSVTAFRMLRAMKQQGLGFATILDGGANAGQFARAAAETYPGARIIAFEPLPDVAEQLRRNLQDCPRVQVVRTALGRQDGELDFFRNAYSLASSALPMSEAAAESFPTLRQQERLVVPVARLDTVLAAEPVEQPVLLKLDLQGYELEALHGATDTLQHTDYVLLEAAFKPVYEGEPLFGELYDFMRAQGFHFLRPLDFLRDARGVIVQMDALFGRAA